MMPRSRNAARATLGVVAGLLATLALGGCAWPRDPDAVKARFDDALAASDGVVAAAADAQVSGPLQCDDGNPCTVDGESGAGCTHAPLDGESCADDAPCLWQPMCEKGSCVGSKRLWSTQFVLGGKRNDAMDAAELDDGSLLVVGQAPSQTLVGSHERPYRMVLRGDGVDISGKPWPHPVWLDPGPQEELTTDATIVRLISQPDADGGPSWIVFGTATDKPVADVPQPSRAYWRRFRLKEAVYQHKELALAGSTSFADAAATKSGATYAVGNLDKGAKDAPNVAGLVCRVYPDGTLNGCATLPPIAPSQHSALRGLAAMPGEKERLLAVGTHAKTQTFTSTEDGKQVAHSGVGDVGGGLLAWVEGPTMAVAWQKPIAPSGGWVCGAFNGAVVLDAATAVVWGELGNPDAGGRQGWRYPHGGQGELWLLKIQTSGGEVLFQQRVKLPGSPRTLVRRGDRLWLHQLAPTPTAQAALWSFDLDLAPRGLTPLPMMTSQRLVALSNGDWLIAGTRQLANQDADTHLMRVDGLGHASCAPDSACASLAVAACDDGLPCTLDGCHATKGCASAAHPDGSGCGTGVCKGGACK